MQWPVIHPGLAWDARGRRTTSFPRRSRKHASPRFLSRTSGALKHERAGLACMVGCSVP